MARARFDVLPAVHPASIVGAIFISFHTAAAGSGAPRAVARRPSAPPRAARSGRSRPCDPRARATGLAPSRVGSFTSVVGQPRRRSRQRRTGPVACATPPWCAPWKRTRQRPCPPPAADGSGTGNGREGTRSGGGERGGAGGTIGWPGKGDGAAAAPDARCRAAAPGPSGTQTEARPYVTRLPCGRTRPGRLNHAGRAPRKVRGAISARAAARRGRAGTYTRPPATAAGAGRGPPTPRAAQSARGTRRAHGLYPPARRRTQHSGPR